MASGRLKASLVQESFEFIEEDESICCLKNDEVILCKVKGKIPTNLKQYLKRKHNKEYKRVLEKEDLKCQKKTQTSVTKAKCKQMTIANMLQTSLFPKEIEK